MFTQNFNKLIACLSRYGRNSDGDGFITLKNLSGADMYVGFKCYNNENDEWNGHLLYADIALGDGASAVSNDQYSLQGNEITLDSVTRSRQYGYDADGSIEVAYMVSGTPLADATIREIALVKDIYRYNNLQGKTMIYRELLSTPIQLRANTPVDLMFKVKLLIQ